MAEENMYEDDIFKERALPEAILVKRAILSSYYNAITYISEYNYRKNCGLSTERTLSALQASIIALYYQIKMKYKTIPKDLKILDDAVLNGKRLDFKTQISCVTLLQEKVEEMGITKIETKQKSPFHAFRRRRS